MKTMIRYFAFAMMLGLLVVAMPACQGQENQTSNEPEKTTETETPEPAVHHEQINENIDVEKFKNMLGKVEGLQVLDVRTPGEVADGYVEGAVHMNIQDGDFADRLNELDKSMPVIVYCAAGGRSARAAGMMQEAGFVEVYNVADGFEGWKAAGFEIAKND